MHQVVFTGRLLKGADRATVEVELQRLFKATPAQVEWFLRGKPIVVKSCEDEAVARRHFDALTKVGLECEFRSDTKASAGRASPAMPTAQLPMQAADMPSAQSTAGSGVQSAGQANTASGHSHPAANLSSQHEVAPATGTSGSAQAAVASRRPPGLGRVTQAMTAQDRAPVRMARPDASSLSPEQLEDPSSLSAAIRKSLGATALLLGAVLLGTLAYYLSLEWRSPQAGKVERQAVLPEPALTDAQAPEPAAPTLAKLLVGRWQCVDSANDRVVEYEFHQDGRFRSVTHGKPDAFQQVEQIDFLIEGRYRLEGRKLVLHVQRIPTRELFGGPVQSDQYLYWHIDSLTTEALSWNDAQVRRISEGCLRSHSLH